MVGTASASSDLVISKNRLTAGSATAFMLYYATLTGGRSELMQFRLAPGDELWGLSTGGGYLEFVVTELPSSPVESSRALPTTQIKMVVVPAGQSIKILPRGRRYDSYLLFSDTSTPATLNLATTSGRSAVNQTAFQIPNGSFSSGAQGPTNLYWSRDTEAWLYNGNAADEGVGVVMSDIDLSTIG
jgi:hypothetical protein